MRRRALAVGFGPACPNLSLVPLRLPARVPGCMPRAAPGSVDRLSTICEMLDSPVASPRRTLGPGWAPLLAMPLAGCTSSDTQGAGLWLFLTAALAATGYAAHTLGRLRARRLLESEVRGLRAELRACRDVTPACTWRCDERGRLLFWRAAADAPALPAATPGFPALLPLPDLFTHPAWPGGAAAPALADLLRAQRAFHALQVHATPAHVATLRGKTWLLHGTPLVDDQGQLAGFVGSARRLDDDLARQAAAAALAPALASAGPCAVALDDGSGWVLRHVHPSLPATWPAAAVGRPLADWTRSLPATVAAAVGLVEPQGAVEVAGWRLQRFDAGAGVQGLWLGQAPGVTGDAQRQARADEADQFSLTAAHDLRAPIRVVEGFTRIVKEDYGRLLDRVGNDHLDRVLGAASRMNLMIDALLTLARLSTQPLARQPVNLSQLAGFVVEDLQRGAPERQADIEIEPGMVAHGDPTLLRLVLDNLLGNAWKYTARCTRPHIVFRSIAHGQQHAFEVRDNGAGFDMRSAERLFGLFQRLHSANDFAGHGVGLASVKRIVQRHGGDIWAEAEPGRGASFQFTLAG
jgi:signal transduction histidine kinase